MSGLTSGRIRNELKNFSTYRASSGTNAPSTPRQNARSPARYTRTIRLVAPSGSVTTYSRPGRSLLRTSRSRASSPSHAPANRLSGLGEPLVRLQPRTGHLRRRGAVRHLVGHVQRGLAPWSRADRYAFSPHPGISRSPSDSVHWPGRFTWYAFGSCGGVELLPLQVAGADVPADGLGPLLLEEVQEPAEEVPDHEQRDDRLDAGGERPAVGVGDPQPQPAQPDRQRHRGGEREDRLDPGQDRTDQPQQRDAQRQQRQPDQARRRPVVWFVEAECRGVVLGRGDHRHGEPRRAGAPGGRPAGRVRAAGPGRRGTAGRSAGRRPAARGRRPRPGTGCGSSGSGRRGSSARGAGEVGSPESYLIRSGRACSCRVGSSLRGPTSVLEARSGLEDSTRPYKTGQKSL